MKQQSLEIYTDFVTQFIFQNKKHQEQSDNKIRQSLSLQGPLIV